MNPKKRLVLRIGLLTVVRRRRERAGKQGRLWCIWLDYPVQEVIRLWQKRIQPWDSTDVKGYRKQWLDVAVRLEAPGAG